MDVWIDVLIIMQKQNEMNKRKHIEETVNRLIGNGEIEVVDAAFAKEYIVYAENKVYKGRKKIKQFTQILRNVFPDLEVLKVVFFLEVENTLTWQRTIRGTQREEMQGIPASNKKVTWNEMIVTRYEDDKIAEECIVSELLGQLLVNQKRCQI